MRKDVLSVQRRMEARTENSLQRRIATNHQLIIVGTITLQLTRAEADSESC